LFLGEHILALLVSLAPSFSELGQDQVQFAFPFGVVGSSLPLPYVASM
jgi:hypothetical protein